MATDAADAAVIATRRYRRRVRQWAQAVRSAITQHHLTASQAAAYVAGTRPELLWRMIRRRPARLTGPALIGYGADSEIVDSETVVKI